MRPRFGIAVLWGVAAMLAGTLVYQLAAPLAPYEVAQTGMRAALPARQRVKAFTVPALTEFAEIDERPLLLPARKPIKVPEAKAAPVQRQPPNVTLVGIILDGKRRIAIAKMGGAQSVNLVPGQMIDGWQVVAIESDGVALTADEQNYKIKLQRPQAGQPVGVPVPAQPARMPTPPGYAPGQVPGR